MSDDIQVFDKRYKINTIGMTNVRNAGNVPNMRQRIRDCLVSNLVESCWVCFSSQDCPRGCTDPGRSKGTLRDIDDFWSFRPSNRYACCAPLARAACLHGTATRWSISCHGTCIPEERIQVRCRSILLLARRRSLQAERLSLQLNQFRNIWTII